MARPAATPEQRRATRRRIREAASAIYLADGAGGISVRAVAERAGVSVGTFYGYYDNLSKLMSSLWKAPLARANETFRKVAGAHEDPVSRIDALLGAYVDFAVGNAPTYRGAFLFVRPDRDPRPEVRARGDVEFFALLHAAIGEGQAAGLVRSGSAEDMAQTIWAGLHGACGMPINMDRVDFDPPAVLAQHMRQALLEWLTVAPDS